MQCSTYENRYTIFVQTAMEQTDTLDVTSTSTASAATRCLPEEVVVLRVYANPIFHYTAERVLLDRNPIFKSQRTIAENSVVLLNHETSRIKILPLGAEFAQWRADRMQGGYEVLAEVRIGKDRKGEMCFNLKGETGLKPDILTNTFVNVHPSRGMQLVRLRDKDLVKMGKELFQVSMKDLKWGEDIEQEQMAGGTCKVCLQQTKRNDWMVSPCKCSGSCSSIHFSCLKEWVGYKSVTEGTNSVSYKVSGHECEICKEPLPRSITFNGRRKLLIPEIHPQDCGTQHVTLKQDTFKGEVYHTVCLSDGPVHMGRSVCNGLLLEELSISRKHATMYMERGRVYLTDCGSKFGTFVLLREERQCRSVRLMSGKWTFDLRVE